LGFNRSIPGSLQTGTESDDTVCAKSLDQRTAVQIAIGHKIIRSFPDMSAVPV